MSYCQCRLKLVFASIFRQFGYRHVALLLDRSDLFSLTVGQYLWLACPLIESLIRLSTSTGKNLEYGLRQEGVLSFVRELDGNDEEAYESYLKDASLYARGTVLVCLESISRDLLSPTRISIITRSFPCPQW